MMNVQTNMHAERLFARAGEGHGNSGYVQVSDDKDRLHMAPLAIYLPTFGAARAYADAINFARESTSMIKSVTDKVEAAP